MTTEGGFMANFEGLGPLGGAKCPLFARFPLETSETARKPFARVIRLFAKGRLDRETYRDLVYGLSAYLNAIKLSRDDAIEARLTELEGRLQDGK